MTVLDWLLDCDPAICWQVLRDLADAPAEIVAAERARTATEGGGPGCWHCRARTASGREAHSSPRGSDRKDGQPWTATAYSLVSLSEFGVDPNSDEVRRAVAQVRERCRWKHAGQPFF